MNAGTGTYAPCNRQAYASKRLQQVVSDFRNKRKKDNTPAIPSRERSRSESSGDEPAVKKKKTVARGNRKTRAKIPGRGRGGHGPTLPSKNSTVCSDDDTEDGEFPPNIKEGIEIPPDPVAVARLRPRPKPRPAYTVTREATEELGPNTI